VCPVKDMWAWKQMTILIYGYLEPDVFSYMVDSVMKAFQRVAAEILGDTPQAYGLRSLQPQMQKSWGGVYRRSCSWGGGSPRECWYTYDKGTGGCIS
jgi:hypothetical protein